MANISIATSVMAI
jgi:hypothetical protein